MKRHTPDAALVALTRFDRSLRAQLALDPVPDGVDTETLLAFTDVTAAAAMAHIERVPGDSPAFSPAIVGLFDAQLKLRKSATHRPALGPRNLAGAIRRIAAQQSAAAVAHQTCTELTTVGDFTAAVISEVHAEHFTVIASAGATSPNDYRNAQIPRRGAELENRCIQLQTHVTSSEVPATEGFATLFGATGHMTAPIICGDTVPALIHVSWSESSAPSVERQIFSQLLGLFADTVGVAYSRETTRHQAALRHQELLARTTRMLNETAGLLNLDLTLSDPGDDTGSEPPAAAAEYASLTPRETEVMRMIANGATNAEIAEQLFISLETVKSHVKKILRKTGSANRSEALARYLDNQ